VYSHCFHCYAQLGLNDTLESFPVGRRFAFDSERGRFWVICERCSRWNLSPLEERWEAFEECERQFRGRWLRAQTTNIGFTVIQGGVGLVRVGRPLRPEFAAWRYGREFLRRRNRALIGASGVAALASGAVFGSTLVGASMLIPVGVFFLVALVRERLMPPWNVKVSRGPSGAWTVSGDKTMILPDVESGWRLSLVHDFGHADFRGDEARRWLVLLFARINRAGGSDRRVIDAVREVEASPGEALLMDVAENAATLWRIDSGKQRKYDDEGIHGLGETRPINRAGLSNLSAVRRLAIEMSLHEAAELRSLQGEFAHLEAAWREAEAIAAIADSLIELPAVDEFVRRHRAR
jgi:hypothetical protein